MAKKKEKHAINKIVERLNKEIEKTSGHLDKLIKDAVKQFDTINTQVQEPVKKILEDMDRVREREIKRFHDEFDRRVVEFNELQRSIFEKLGIPLKKSTGSIDDQGSGESTSEKSKPSRRATAKATGTKKTTTKEPALTKLFGVGPVLAKKLNEAGITSVKQVAAPTEAEKAILQQFEKNKGYDQWQSQAKELIS